jgi:uncharacterized Zn finger protein
VGRKRDEDHWWPRYVTAAEKRRRARAAAARLLRMGRGSSPVTVGGRAIARTFWGKAWCANLEQYSDFSNRLPRGRTYLRKGRVLDLQIGAGKVTALVSGSALYTVTVTVARVPRSCWESICTDTAGSVDTLVELLQGELSQNVMARICRKGDGLFPASREIDFSCSCPDWASMCKHVAAVLYGAGARLDEQPELLFTLRQVEGKDLVAGAGAGLPLRANGPEPARILEEDGLAEIFGLEMADTGPLEATAKTRAAGKVPAFKKARAAAQAPATTGAASEDALSEKQTKKRVAKVSAVQELPAKKPAAKKPTARKPTAKTPAAKTPAAKKPPPGRRSPAAGGAKKATAARGRSGRKR